MDDGANLLEQIPRGLLDDGLGAVDEIDRFSRLAFAVGKVNVKATRNIIEVLTLLISRQRLNEIIQQRFRAERVKQLAEGKFVVKHFRYSIPAPLLEQEGL